MLMFAVFLSCAHIEGPCTQATFSVQFQITCVKQNFHPFIAILKYYVAVQGGEDSIRLWGGGPPGGANELAHAHSFYVATVTVLCAAAHTLQKTNQID